MPRIYLDNAATSWPKPESVYLAVDRYQRELGAAYGRGTSRSGMNVQRLVDRCRLHAARFFDADRPEQVVFTGNGTEALNLALHGLLREDDHVITTTWDHNSVLRPLHTLQQRRGIRTTILPGDGSGGIDLNAFEIALKQPTRLVVATHASNVTGVIQPIPEMAKLSRERGAMFLLDAAQTAGHLPVSLHAQGVDLIACPGHKGLLGPLGTGLLVMRAGLEQEVQPLLQGGTGTVSESPEQPGTSPERFEAGNLNVPGIAGLAAGLDSLESLQNPECLSRQAKLLDDFVAGLLTIRGVTVFHPAAARVGVVSISMQRLEPHILSSLLDQQFGIETRAGLHCAPLAHQALGTLESGGTVRFSLGPFTTAADIDMTLESLAQIGAAL